MARNAAPPIASGLIAVAFVFSVTAFAPPADAATARQSVSDRLDRICHFLEQENPNQRAAARRQLSEQVAANDVDGLRAYLERRLSPVALRALRERFEEIIDGSLEELETHIIAFEAARLRAREHAAADRAESTDDTRERLRQTRLLRDQAYRNAHTGFDAVVRQGIAIAPSLWRRIEAGGSASPGILRCRERLTEQIIEAARKTLPAAPQEGTIAPFLEFALVPLAHALDDGDPEGWEAFRERMARRAITELSAFEPPRRRAGRELFLQLGTAGVERLDAWAESDDAVVPKPVRERFARWNRLAVPVAFLETTGLDIADYADRKPKERLEILYRLEWVGGDKSIPIFARLLASETDLSLQVECAAALARLRDPRGAEFLRQLGLGNSLALESVSRDVLLIEALHRRNSGDIEGALEDLQELVRRFEPSFRVHYELAMTALRARRLPLAITQFQKALELQPDDALCLYNLACAQALAGESDDALDSLRKSVAAGFTDREHMLADPDLESLRELEEFRGIIRGLTNP